MKRRYRQSAILVGVVLIISAYVQGCGGNNAVPPSPPPAPAPVIPMNLSNLPDIPGTPWSQMTPQARQEVVNAVRLAVVRDGNSTVRNNEQFAMAYRSTPTRQGVAIIEPFGEPVPEKSQISSLFLFGRTSREGYITLDFVDREENDRVYIFMPRVEVAGSYLYSTDQVALFRTSDTSDNGTFGIVKVPFRQQNPVIYSFLIQPLETGARLRPGIILNVVQRVLFTRFSYVQ